MTRTPKLTELTAAPTCRATAEKERLAAFLAGWAAGVGRRLSRRGWRVTAIPIHQVFTR